MRFLFLCILSWLLFGWIILKLPENYSILLNVFCVFLFFCLFFNKIRLIVDKNHEYLIVAGSFVAMVMLFVFGRFYETSFLYLCLMCPAMILLMAKSVMDEKLLRQLFLFFICLFVFNALISYYERITESFLLYEGPLLWESSKNEELSSILFRSPALLGHPLQNAMIMAYMMIMVLLFHIKFKYKFLLWFFGFLSLFCFNARGSILLSALLFVWYMVFMAKSPNKLLKFVGLCLLFLVLFAFLFFLFSTPLAGRLLSGAILEGNGEERIRIWYVLGEMNLVDFIIGLTEDDYVLITKSLDLYTAESWLALFIIRMGLPFTIFFVVVYSKLLWNLLPNVEKQRRFFLLFSFFLLASMNNSLAVTATPLIIALLTAPVFNTYYITRVSE